MMHNRNPPKATQADLPIGRGPRLLLRRIDDHPIVRDAKELVDHGLVRPLRQYGRDRVLRKRARRGGARRTRGGRGWAPESLGLGASWARVGPVPLPRDMALTLSRSAVPRVRLAPWLRAPESSRPAGGLWERGARATEPAGGRLVGNRWQVMRPVALLRRNNVQHCSPSCVRWRLPTRQDRVSAHVVACTPPSPCESNTDVPKFDGNGTCRCSDKGVALVGGRGGVSTCTARPWSFSASQRSMTRVCTGCHGWATAAPNASSCDDHHAEHRQKAATRRNMRREERVTVQGPVKEHQPDGMSHRGSVGRGWPGPQPKPPPPPPRRPCSALVSLHFGRHFIIRFGRVKGGGGQGSIRMAANRGRRGVTPPRTPPPDHSDRRGKTQNLPSEKPCWPIFGTQTFGSRTPPPF